MSAGLVLLSAPPLDIYPLAFISLVPLCFALYSAGPARATLLGWLTGFLVNVIGQRWAVDVIMQFGHTARLTSVVIVMGISAYQACVFGVWAGFGAWLRRRGIPWMVTAPLLLIVAEWAMPFLLPWQLGVLLWRVWPLAQVAEFGGTPVVSGWLLATAWLVVEAIRARADGTSLPRSVRAAAIAWAALSGLGLARAAHVASARNRSTALPVGVVQPNFGIVTNESRKMNGEEYIRKLRRATAEAGQQGAELVIWPESAFPFLMDRSIEAEYPEGHPWELRGGYKGRLLVGTLAHRFGVDRRIYNASVLFGSDRHLAGVYEKHELLVFGEYIPFADRYPDWAARVREQMPDSSEIAPGSGELVLRDGPLKVAPLICYEDILAERVARIGPDANLLVTQANHAWFGDSAALPQALALASFRAIEARRDLVRTTNTGLSSFTDALGRTTDTTSIHAIDPKSPVPAEVLTRPVRLVEVRAWGAVLGWLVPCLALAGVFILALRSRKEAQA